MDKYDNKKLNKMMKAYSKHIEKKRLKKDREALLNDERTPYARKISRNIDQLLIVASIAQPDFSYGVVDRFIILASYEEIVPILCITKIDLTASEASVKCWTELYENLGIPVHTISTIKNIGIDTLNDKLKGKRTALAGHSGVGKSTILNTICPSLKIETGQVNLMTGKGRHITRSVRLYRLDEDTEVFDLPGIKLIDFPDLNPVEVAGHFPDFRPYDSRCRFSDCSHLSEPGCAVKDAIDTGELKQERYNSYLNIIEELKL
jgi:ribosome biogenesis GTPase